MAFLLFFFSLNVKWSLPWHTSLRPSHLFAERFLTATVNLSRRDLNRKCNNYSADSCATVGDMRRRRICDMGDKLLSKRHLLDRWHIHTLSSEEHVFIETHRLKCETFFFFPFISLSGHGGEWEHHKPPLCVRKTVKRSFCFNLAVRDLLLVFLPLCQRGVLYFDPHSNICPMNRCHCSLTHVNKHLSCPLCILVTLHNWRAYGTCFWTVNSLFWTYLKVLFCICVVAV